MRTTDLSSRPTDAPVSRAPQGVAARQPGPDLDRFVDAAEARGFDARRVARAAPAVGRVVGEPLSAAWARAQVERLRPQAEAAVGWRCAAGLRVEVISRARLFAESRARGLAQAWLRARLVFASYDIDHHRIRLVDETCRPQSTPALEGVLLHELVHAAQANSPMGRFWNAPHAIYLSEGHALTMQQRYVGAGFTAGLRLDSPAWRLARLLQAVGELARLPTLAGIYRLGHRGVAALLEDDPARLGDLYRHECLCACLFGTGVVQVPEALLERAHWLAARNPVGAVVVQRQRGG